MPLSPKVAGADRAVAFFDAKRKSGTRTPGRWVTVIKHGDLVDVDEHNTQAEAHEFIGLEGGSTSPTYKPSWGQTDIRIAVG